MKEEFAICLPIKEFKGGSDFLLESILKTLIVIRRTSCEFKKHPCSHESIAKTERVGFLSQTPTRRNEDSVVRASPAAIFGGPYDKVYIGVPIFRETTSTRS